MKYLDFLNNIKEKSPLIHHITNYVTVNDCANISLAIGASPIMTAYDEEFEDIANISSALVLNIGTMDKTDIYEKAVKIANSKNVPVVFDPVGVGASKARNNTVQGLLSNGKFCVIKGNVSEIMAINKVSANTKGVDASQEDQNTDIYSIVNVCKDISNKYDTVVTATGKNDIIVYKNDAYIVKNGVSFMSKVTGTGCMSASLIASFVASNNDITLSTLYAIATIGIAGELAYEKTKHLGSGSFRVALIDEISMMNEEKFENYSKIEKLS